MMNRGIAWIAAMLVLGGMPGAQAEVASSMPVSRDGGRVNFQDGRLTLSLTPEYTPSPWTENEGYLAQSLGKLAFGMRNLLWGWTDLFREPLDATASGENVFVGIGWGIKDSLLNLLGGAMHLATFPIPYLDTPLPEGGI